jgi:hypothetical protein
MKNLKAESMQSQFACQVKCLNLMKDVIYLAVGRISRDIPT